jgi:hypothetical protein
MRSSNSSHFAGQTSCDAAMSGAAQAAAVAAVKTFMLNVDKQMTGKSKAKN